MSAENNRYIALLMTIHFITLVFLVDVVNTFIITTLGLHLGQGVEGGEAHDHGGVEPRPRVRHHRVAPRALVVPCVE